MDFYHTRRCRAQAARRWVPGVCDPEFWLLTSLIETKFGSPSSEVRTRIEAATQTQVARWAKRILTATSVDELFQD